MCSFRWFACGLAFLLPISIVEAAPPIKIDPTRTYLRANPADPAVGDTPAIDLAALGIAPGDLIRLRRLGTYTRGVALDPEAPLDLIGVFAGSAALGDRSQLNRVTGAVNGGVAPPFITEAIPFAPQDLATDIVQDFVIRDVHVRVPVGAAYLFVAAPDFYYSDNGDGDGDLYLEITRIEGRFDPRRTYLSQPDDRAVPPFIVDLQAMGVSPGMPVHLERRGDYTYWTTNDQPEVGTYINAVFSSSPIVLDRRSERRVPDAIPIPHTTGTAPNFGDSPNDIPGDFWFSGDATVSVPPNARYLVVGVPDPYNGDNADLDGDLEVLLNGVPLADLPSPLTPPDSPTPSFTCPGTLCLYSWGDVADGTGHPIAQDLGLPSSGRDAFGFAQVANFIAGSTVVGSDVVTVRPLGSSNCVFLQTPIDPSSVQGLGFPYGRSDPPGCGDVGAVTGWMHGQAGSGAGLVGSAYFGQLHAYAGLRMSQYPGAAAAATVTRADDGRFVRTIAGVGDVLELSGGVPPGTPGVAAFTFRVDGHGQLPSSSASTSAAFFIRGGSVECPAGSAFCSAPFREWLGPFYGPTSVSVPVDYVSGARTLVGFQLVSVAAAWPDPSAAVADAALGADFTAAIERIGAHEGTTDNIGPAVGGVSITSESGTNYSAFMSSAGTLPATTLAAAPATGTFGGTADLAATLTASGAPVAGRTIEFRIDGVSVGTGATDATGTARLAGASLAGLPIGSYLRVVEAIFPGDASLSPAVGTAAVTIAPVPVPEPVVDLGTFSIGEVWAQLRGEFSWALDPGTTLPEGLSLRTETPPWFPADAHAGIIGITAKPGTYTFTLLRSGVPSPYRLTIVPLTIKDYWTLPDAFVNDLYSYQFTALNAVGAPQWSIAPETLPPGMTADAAGLLSGTPSTPGNYQISVQVTDGGVSASRQVTLRVYAVRITTPGLLPNATLGAPYVATIAATGGTAPYSFSSFDLPPGLQLHPDGTIDGTPHDAEGHWWFNVTATDANHTSYTKAMSLGLVGVPPSMPGVNPYDGELQDCSIGTPCSMAAWVGNGGRAPFTWTQADGLPAGMSIRSGGGVVASWIAPANAEIWGTPTEAGTFPVQFTVVDADGRSVTNTFPLRVSVLRLFNYLPGGTVGTPYSHHFMVIGGRLPYTVALAGGRLPYGLTFDPAALTVSGTPLEDGNFHAVFEFTDADGKQVRVHNYFTVVTTSPVRILDDDDEDAVIQAGEELSFQFSGCCAASYVWSLEGGTPPTGLTISASGLVSGTPPAGTAGRFTFQVRAADASNPANSSVRQFTVSVTPLTISSNLPIGEVGAAYNGSVSAAGGSVSWSLDPFQYMPPGLTVQSNGAIVGTPAKSGRYRFALRSTDAAHSLTWDFTIDVYPAGKTPIGLSLGPDLWTVVGPATWELQATGGTPPYAYSLTPGAPPAPGMRIQDGPPLPTYFLPGVTAGFIGVAETPGSYSTSIRVTDTLGQTFDRAITLHVAPVRILSQTVPPHAVVGIFYAFNQDAYGAGAYNWQAANLPPGLDIDHASGRIFGTPQTAGTFFPAITLTDPGSSLSDTVTLTLTVDPYPIANGWALPTGFVGTNYGQVLNAPACGAPCTWSLAGGTLPNGLSVSATGTIGGTPTAAGTFTFTVRVSGTNGSTQRVMSMRVGASTPQALSIVPTGIADITIGTPATFALIAQGGAPPYQWSVLPGAGGADPLPPGVTLQTPGETLGANFTAGVPYLAGRPMQAGIYPFTVQLTDSAGTTRQRTFSWNVSRLSSQYGNLPLAGHPLVYNTPYAQPLLVMGGSGTYAFTSTPMPPGLMLQATGIVDGIPGNTGSFNASVQASDGSGNSVTRGINLLIAGPTGTTPTITTGPNLGLVALGGAATFPINAFGGTPPYTVTALSLPPGFAVAPPAAITGIATSAGLHTFTLQLQDAVGNIAVRTFTLTVAAFSVPTPELPDAAVNVPYSVALQPVGAPALTWSSTAVLPAGLDISPAGVISGVPTASGTFTLQLQASDGTSTIGVRPFLRISNVAMTSERILPVAIVGSPFTYTFSTTGGGAGKNWWSGSLPDGLQLTPSGTLEGVPRASGTFTVDVWVSDGGTPAFSRFVLYVRHPNAELLDITTPSTLPDVVVGRYGSIQLEAQGGIPPYQWAVASGASVPAGVALVSGSEVPAALGATPGSAFLIGRLTTPGSYSFDVIVTDSVGTHAQRTFTLKASTVGFVMAGEQLPTARTGASYRADILGIGGTAPYTFSARPGNPVVPGVTLSSSGAIAGTPTSTGFYHFTVQVRDAEGRTYSAPVQLTSASASGLVVTNDDPPDIAVGQGGHSFELTARPLSGEPATYSWSVIGGLPPGMSLLTGDDVGPGATALVGQPTTPGTYPVTVRASNTTNASDTADHVFTIHVTPFHIVAPPVAFQDHLHLPAGTAGQPYATTVKVAGGGPAGFSVTEGSALPPGLGLSAAGVLSGTPTGAGRYTVDVTIKDLAGNATSESFRLDITPAGMAPPLVISDDDTELFPATNGAPYLFNLDLLVEGGAGSLTWALAAGSTLPDGLTILPGGNGVPAHLGGMPAVDGEFSFTLTVGDERGQTLSIPATIFILPAEGRPLTDTLPAGRVGAPYSARVITPIGDDGFTAEVLPFLDLPPGLALTGATLAGTPQAAGNFVIAIRYTHLASQGQVFKLYLVTIDNAAGQAPAVTLSPEPISIYYTLGAPSPAPTHVYVQATSGSQPVQLHLSGAPWGSLGATSVATSAVVDLSVNVNGLAAGTYFGMLGANAPGAVGYTRAVPVLLHVSAAPVAAPGGASPLGPVGITTDSRPIFKWTSAAAAGYYLLSIEDGSGARSDYWFRPAEAGCADGGGTCAVVLPRALAAGQATWKVLAWNSAGYGPWSATTSVFVNLSNGSLPAPVAVGPSGSTATRTPSYVWNTTTGAAWYLLEITDAGGTTRDYPVLPAESCTSTLCTVTPPIGMPLGSSHWQVRAGNAGGGGAWSAPMAFVVSDPTGPPARPTLVSPSPGATAASLPVTFTWNAAAGTVWYLLRVVDRDNSTQNYWYRPDAAGCPLGTGTCGVARADVKPGPVAWQVVAWNAEGYSPWSDLAQFWLDIADPAAGVPQPISPMGPTTAALIRYRWTAVPGAIGYRVSVHNAGSPAQYAWVTAADAGCGAECEAAVGISVAAGVNAEWQVQASTANGHGPWSLIAAFTIAAAAPARPVLVSPEGATGATPSFTWNASANVTLYYIQVDDVTGRRVDRWLRPADVGCAAGTGTCSLTPGVLLASGAGSWRVIAWNAAGYSPWSVLGGFAVP